MTAPNDLPRRFDGFQRSIGKMGSPSTGGATSSSRLDAVRAHRLAFWDALLWASAQRAGVRHLLTEGFQDGFVLQDVTFINPFMREYDGLIEKLLPRPALMWQRPHAGRAAWRRG
jgi:hypothetical protein